MAIITKGGLCSTHKKPMGFQFAKNGGSYRLGGSFVATGNGVTASDEAITGDVPIADSYTNYGCRLCGKKFAYICPACGTVVCNDGNGKTNETCPACKSTINVARAVGNAMPKVTLVNKTRFTVNKGDASENSPYTQWAGVSVIEGAAKDAYGNAKGSQYDLAKDGAFKGYTIIVINMSDQRNFSYARAALEKKGFTIKMYDYTVPSDSELERLLNTPDSQLWFLADRTAHLGSRAVELICNYYLSGHGVYIWSDNDPFYVDTNTILKRIYGSGVYMFGNYIGDRVLGIQPYSGKPGIIANHPITTGLVSFYEGITISSVKMGSDRILPLMYNSECGIVAAYDSKDGHRALIDGGFTRLFCNWDSAGTDRYVVNAAAWLTNIERFGYHKH